GIELVWTPPERACVTSGDAGQLVQVVVNLLGNAIEAAGPGGTVEVRMQKSECRTQNEEEESLAGASGFLPSSFCIRFEVYGKGRGRRAELAGRLCEPFVTGKPEGVGLGLAVARRVAEGHGGTISWRREEGKTCFRVVLPTSDS